MSAIKILLIIVILGAFLAGGGYYLVHRTEVQVQVPQVQAPATQPPPAPDYGSYATAKHPKFPGVDSSQSEGKGK